MAKIWVAVNVGVMKDGVVASTSLAEIGRVVGCSVWTLRRLKREQGEEGFTVEGDTEDGLRLPWFVCRVELRRVAGRGKGGRTGYMLKEKK